MDGINSSGGSDTLSAEGAPRGIALWGWWTLATALSWAVAGACIGFFVDQNVNATQYIFIPIGAVGQWLVLRRHFARAGVWLAATAAGAGVAALAYVVLLALPLPALGPTTSGLRLGLSTMVDGLALGVAQWLVLRRNVRGPEHWWIAATAMPLWLLALNEFQRGAEPYGPLPAMDQVDWVAAAAANLGVIGLVMGVLTGAVLAWMVDRPRVYEEA